MTVELALGLPAVVFLLGAVLVLGSAGVGQLRCADGARAGARASALGEEPAAIVAIARRVAGDGATVLVDRTGPWVTVTVGRSVAGGLVIGTPLRAEASAVARVEP